MLSSLKTLIENQMKVLSQSLFGMGGGPWHLEASSDLPSGSAWNSMLQSIQNGIKTCSENIRSSSKERRPFMHRTSPTSSIWKCRQSSRSAQPLMRRRAYSPISMPLVRGCRIFSPPSRIVPGSNWKPCPADRDPPRQGDRSSRFDRSRPSQRWTD